MTSQFDTKANTEQKNAIFHNGGVLLSAGAGSGKTFVLVEHIAYLIWQHHQNESSRMDDDYIRELKNYLSSIVLMTFTKKAAGELAIRLKSKMQQLLETCQTEEDRWLWGHAGSCLDSMTVGTIDGFCYKLIAQGFFPGLPSEMAVISDIEANQKISDLFDEWINFEYGSTIDELRGVDQFFISHRREFVDAFIKIFTTPELRLLWKESDTSSMLNYDWNDFNDVVFAADHPSNLYQRIPDTPDGSKGAWVEKLSLLGQYFSQKRDWNVSALVEMNNFFTQNKNITTGPRTDGDVKDFFSAVKRVKDIAKNIAEELEAYENEGRSVLEYQVQQMLNAFAWIERRYSQIPGFTFADLEYFVMLGLKDNEAQSNVTNRYRYLIVDEFQDTSLIQFDIIRRIIDNNFGRLFCVGDEKQAIYGFRGGELAVFQDCKKLIPRNLSLANNYRSQGNVIAFNNALFANLFMRGEGYEGLDPHPVAVASQLCPLEERQGQGVINKHRAVIDLDAKVRVSESNMVEAEADEILLLIKKSLEVNSDEEICVLYKGLKPSLGLMSSLISHGFGLRAQVKVPYPQDPMLALFTVLIEGIQLAKQKKTSILETATIFFTRYLLGYLAATTKSLNIAIEAFQENSQAIGLVAAFGDFLHRCGVANSNHPGNMAEIERIVALAGGDYELILSLLASLADKKYSIEFQTPGIGSVVIMTTHASKGLQFPHVILGGIHTNGRRIPSRDIVGKLPGSLKWRAQANQKNKYRSPQMIMESAIDSLKDFAEAKRLFYVACTRAESRLSWVDLSDSNGKELSYHKNSWVNGIRTFESSDGVIGEYLELFDHLKDAMTLSQRALIDETTSTVSESVLPMFHLDPLGATAFENQDSSSLVLFPELSVTKLATISQCPRKFYLKHICKLDEDFELDRKEMLEEKMIQNDIVVDRMASSAQRGILVHEAIAHAVTHRGVISLAHQKELGVKETKAVTWATQKVMQLSQHYEIVSEKGLKFDFFGQMVSGTPDLVLLPKNEDNFYVVDFKTGRPGGDKEAPYWFQLRCYAHAIKTLTPQQHWAKAKLELWYVDAEEVKTEQLSLVEIDHLLANEWSKLSRPFQSVISHCEQCSFGKICHPRGR